MKTKGIKLAVRGRNNLFNASESVQMAIEHVRREDFVLARMCAQSAIRHINSAIKRLKMADEKGRSYY